MSDDTFYPCDACGSRSYVHVWLTTGQDLDYCAHHGSLWWDQLNRIGLVTDNRAKVLAPRTPVEA